MRIKDEFKDFFMNPEGKQYQSLLANLQNEALSELLDNPDTAVKNVAIINTINILNDYFYITGDE